MSDSVGKISLDLEIQSDIGKQISSVSNAIANNLKKNLNNSIKSTLESANTGTKKTLNNITNSINSTMKKSMINVRKTITSILSNIKIPKINIPKPTNISTPKTVDKSANVSKRGPPINKEVLSSQISNVTTTLDNVNNRIDQQRTKLAQLKEAYRTAFNPTRKNALEEKILKTESNINKLIGQSDKLGFKLAELDDKMAILSTGTNKAATSNNKLKSSLSTVGSATDRANKGLNNLSNSTKKANNAMNNHRSNLSIIIRSMFTWGIVFPMVLRGLQFMATGLLNNLKTNEQFSNSLAQIKSNLMIAFTPIYQAILPAINALMSALSVATQYIASFISSIFGKTFNDSKQATQGLIDAKEAMGAYGDSAKAAGKAAKDALGLASFDEINTLGSSSDSADGGGSGGASKVPQLVTPALDTSSVDGVMKKLTDKIKTYFATFNFEPLIQSFNKVKSAVEPIINNLGKVIKWFLVEILDPLAKWTVSDLIPAFLNLIAGALGFLNPILEAFMSLGAWLWDNFLQPISAWTGGAIVDTLNGLASALSTIGDWMSNNKGAVEGMTITVAAFFAAWKTTELLGFIGESGGVIGALKRVGTALFATTALKLKDKLETMYLTALYAKDFVASIGSSIKSLILQAKQLAINTGAKIADKAETLALIGLYAKDFVVSLAKGTIELVKQASQWVVNTGLKIADTAATVAMNIATAAWNVVAGIATVATTALGAALAFLTSPIGLVIISITALIATGVLLYKHWDVIKAKAIEVWDNIKIKFEEFKNWLGNVFSTDWSKRFGFMGDILNGFLVNIKNKWDGIKQIFQGIIDFVAGIFTGNWSRAWQGVVNIFGGIMGTLGGIIKSPLNAVISLINGAISGLNRISVNIPSWIPGIGGSHFGVNIPKVPYLARGGLIDSPTLAMIGETHKKEAVVPLEGDTGALDLIASKLMERMGGSITNTNKDRAIEIILQLGDLQFARVLIDSINKLTEMNGGECLIRL